MTSRERVGKAVNFQVPDRVPVDLGGMKASEIAAGAYHRLKKLLGIRGATKVSDLRFMIAAVEPEMLRRFHVDVVPVDLFCIAVAVRPARMGVRGLLPLLEPDHRPCEQRDPRRARRVDGDEGDTCSTRCTTSRPMSLRRTRRPCSTPPTISAVRSRF